MEPVTGWCIIIILDKKVRAFDVFDILVPADPLPETDNKFTTEMSNFLLDPKKINDFFIVFKSAFWNDAYYATG